MEKIITGRKVRHGNGRRGKRTPEYIAWGHMKSRCYIPTNASYKGHGGRGIIVCDRWLHSFENFLADMGERPSSKHSLDRFPDKNGNYEPSNCRWATPIEQSNNTRRNRIIVFNGQTKTASEWGRELGIYPEKIINRLNKKMPIELVFSKERIPTYWQRC